MKGRIAPRRSGIYKAQTIHDVHTTTPEGLWLQESSVHGRLSEQTFDNRHTRGPIRHGDPAGLIRARFGNLGTVATGRMDAQRDTAHVPVQCHPYKVHSRN